MCGRYVLAKKPERVLAQLNLSEIPNFSPRWNIGPSQSAIVIVNDGMKTEIIEATWGLQQPQQIKKMLINARMETVNVKPTFRSAFLKSRCLVLADGWYEWSAEKKPWYVKFLDDEIMSFGGLVFRGKDVSNFVIITTPSTGSLSSIHHRQPLVLPRERERKWLTSENQTFESLLEPAPSEWFNWYRVSAQVGSINNDHPGLIEPTSIDKKILEEDKQGRFF